MWVFLLMFFPFLQTIKGPFASQILFPIISILNYAIPYYILLLGVFPYFDRNKFLFFLSYTGIILLFFIIDFLNLRIILPAFGGYRYRVDTSMPDFIQGTLLHFFYLAIPSTGFYLNKMQQDKVKKNIQKEKEILSMELNFLSNQFHSHLTFNFLNFCYRKLQISSSAAAESIITFSNMLHYSLSIKDKELVLLSEEIDYIENFIEIQKCITNNVFIDFKCEGNFNSKRILPGILGVFIENAFKHGVFNDPNHPMKIRINVNENILNYTIENRKTTKPHFLNTGIGIENIKEVLQISYKNLHSLVISANNFDYISQLKLQLN